MSHEGVEKSFLEVSNVTLEAEYSLFSGTLINVVTFKLYTFFYTEDYRGHFKRHIDDEANLESVLYVSVYLKESYVDPHLSKSEGPIRPGNF